MSATIQTAASNQLRRNTLGIGFIIFFVVSAASPLSVIAGGFPLGIMLGNGAGTPALVLAALVIMLIFAVGYTTMARHVTNAGGFYAFSCRGIGSTAGAAAGVLAVFAYNILQIGLYGMFGGVVSATVESMFGFYAPWWAYSLLAMVSIAILGYRNIDLSARVLSAVVIAEYVAVLTLDICILRQGGAGGVNLDAFRPTQVLSGTPAIGLLFCFAAFLGSEATTIYGEEAKDPHRTIPIATYASMLLIGGFYAISLWSLVVGAGTSKIVPLLRDMKDPTSFIYVMSEHYAGAALTTLIRVLFVVSIYAGLLAFHNSAARYFYAIGRDGLLHWTLGTTHRVHQSPHVGSALQSLIAAVVVAIFIATNADPILNLFTWFSSVATLCVMVLMAMTSISVLGYFVRHPELEPSIWRTCIFPAMASLALLFILVTAVLHFDVLTGASKTLSYALCGVIPGALVLGVMLARRLRRRAPHRYRTLGSDRL